MLQQALKRKKKLLHWLENFEFMSLWPKKISHYLFSLLLGRGGTDWRVAARTISTSNTNIRIRYTHSQSGTGVCMKYFLLFFFTTKRYLSQSLCKWIVMTPFFVIFIDKLINFFLTAVKHLYDTMCQLKGLFVLIKWIFFFFCLFVSGNQVILWI